MTLYDLGVMLHPIYSWVEKHWFEGADVLVGVVFPSAIVAVVSTHTLIKTRSFLMFMIVLLLGMFMAVSVFGAGLQSYWDMHYKCTTVNSPYYDGYVEKYCAHRDTLEEEFGPEEFIGVFRNG